MLGDSMPQFLWILSALTLGFGTAPSAFANVITTTWTISDLSGQPHPLKSSPGQINALQLIDDANIVGDERLIWWAAGEAKELREVEVAPDSYSASDLERNPQGTPIRDLGWSLNLGQAFQSTLELLQHEAFAQSFVAADLQCPATATAYLILTDNLSGKMYGYCLTPQ